MALKEIITRKLANQKTFDKLNRDLAVLPPSHADKGRILSELNSTKARMTAER